MTKHHWLRAAIAAALALTAVGCSRTIETAVPVMLAAEEGVTVAGGNPVYVKPGEDVSFQIALSDGVFYLGNDAGADYDGTTLTLSRVLYPTTVTIETVTDPKYYELSLLDPTLGGTIRTTVAPGEDILGGSAVTVTAVPREGYVFECWTNGKSLARGGTKVADTVEYAFTLDADTVLYANYITEAEQLARDSMKTATLLYSPNGGTITDAEADQLLYTQEVDVTDFPLPNCLANRGYFRREGYQLIEYNTAPDGTGEGYSLGSKIILPEGETSILLHCIWAKESDPALFKTRAEKDGTLAITSYTGDEDTVVIPSYIDGKEVTRIVQGAFKGKKFTTLVFPDTLKHAEAKAFIECGRFTTLYMCDDILSIYDDTFTVMENFKNFRLNAKMPPKYAGSTEGNFSRKWERLVTTQDRNRVVVMSGSSSLYGLATLQLQELLKDEYVVVNYGTNAGTAATFYMEVCAPYMHEGDILIQAPCPGNGTQLGSNEITWRLFRGTEAYYNVFRLVDISRYNRLFTALREFNEGRVNMSNSSYTQVSSGIDEYGDITAKYPLNPENYNWSKNSMLNPNAINDTMAANLKYSHDCLKASGVTVYFSFGISNRNTYSDKSLTDEYFAKVDAGYAAKLTVPVISTIGDYTFEGKYLSNSNAHLGDEGRRIRTDRLYRDLAAQMEKDGIPVP